MRDSRVWIVALVFALMMVFSCMGISWAYWTVLERCAPDFKSGHFWLAFSGLAVLSLLWGELVQLGLRKLRCLV